MKDIYDVRDGRLVPIHSGSLLARTGEPYENATSIVWQIDESGSHFRTAPCPEIAQFFKII